MSDYERGIRDALAELRAVERAMTVNTDGSGSQPRNPLDVIRDVARVVELSMLRKLGAF